MSASLATLGLEAPAAPAAGGGGGGPSGIRVYFSMVADGTDGVHAAGTYVAGLDLSGGGVTQVSTNGANYAARAGAAPHSIGGGDYYYEFDATEIATPPTVLVKVVLAGYNQVHVEKDIGDPAQVSDVTTAASSITAAVVAVQSAIAASIASAQAAINLHTDTDTTATQAAVASALTAIEADIAAALTSTLSGITAGANSVNAHTDAALVPIASTLARILAIHGDNSLLDGGPGFPNVRYNAKRLMLGARLRVFASAAALAAATAGADNDDDGEIYRWSMTGADNGIGLDGTFSRARDL